MSRAELSEHLSYLTDGPKVAMYEAAFAELVKPGDIVVDLGCGTGLLGLLALRAGAAKVYAIDGGSILGLAGDIAYASGLSELIVPIRASSLDATVPEPADLVVADQMGGLAYDAGVLQYFADARRFLRPGGSFVPGSFTMLMAAMAHPQVSEAVTDWRSHRPAGLDFSPAATLSANTVQAVNLEPPALLSEVVLLGERAADDASTIDVSATAIVHRSGTLDGVVGMFRGSMSPSVTMSNVPGAADQMKRRWQNAYPLERPVQVDEGATVTFSFHANPMTYRCRWHVVVRSADGTTLADEQHGSFLGEFIEQRDLERNRPTRQLTVSNRLDAWKFAIARIEAGVTKKELEEALASQHGALFERPVELTRFVSRVIGAFDA